MKWMAAVVIFHSEPVEQAVDLISSLFYDLGLSGVVVDDPGLEPSEGWGQDALKKPEHHAVTGYIPKDDSLAIKCRKLETWLSELKEKHGIISEICYHEVDEEDWAESWKTYFRPERITDKIVVKPSWREYKPHKDEIIIEIDPGMAFGTGTHPTTSLCIQMIQEFLTPGDDFLDVGTGSGILMIAAAKLGAARLYGIDTDSVACDIARKNLLLNGIEQGRFKVQCANLVDEVSDKFQMISANILTDVIMDLLDDVHNIIAPSGILICSGIIEANGVKIIPKMESAGLIILDVKLKDGWMAIAARNMTP